MNGRAHWVRACLGVTALSGAACRDVTPTAAVTPPPSFADVAVGSNAFNAISAVVTFWSGDADSARVSCRPDSGPDVVTPGYALDDSAASIVVLGLSPGTSYQCAVAAVGPGGGATSTAVAYRTADLPASVKAVQLAITGSPPPGYIITEVTRGPDAMVLAFDSAGHVAWYRMFAAQPGELAMQTEQLANGDFTVYVGASTGWQPVDGRFIEFRPDGGIVRTFTAGAPYYTDSHELLLTLAGGAVTAAHLYGYQLRTVDLTSLGGRPDQVVAGHTLLRQTEAGATQFQWNAWDHFSIADWIFVPPNLATYPTIDYDHPNSLAFDRDGNYIVSFASLGEITTIEARTGQVLWRLGGRHNQFTFVNDPLGGFGFQHDVRALDNGDLLFFDNGLGHTPPQSRAVEYRLDLPARTATLVWEYRHVPSVFNPIVGSVQRLRNGNTLVGYGAKSFMVETTAGGEALWEGRLTVDGQPVQFFYRARRIASLYHYEQP